MATTTLDAPAGQRIDYAAILSGRDKAIIMLGVMLGLFLSALDQTIVSTALPRIVADLQGLDLLAWVSTAYLLTNTAMVPIYGKLSDIYGRKIILIIGIGVFLTASVLCGLATSMIQLVFFRGLQGIGGAALTSTAFAVPADIFVPSERARYQGLTTAVFGLASVIGPFLGGLLTDNLSWHWVFLVNLPVGIVALAFIILKMPKLDSGVRSPIDFLGSFLLLVAVVPLLLGLSLDKTTYAWSSPQVLGLLALAAVGTIAFIWAEQRAKAPILSFSLFRNKVFALVIPVSVLVGAGFFAAVLFLSLYLINVLDVSATAAGTALIPLMGGLVAGSIGSSAIVQRSGRYKAIILLGLATMIGGFYWLTLLETTTTLGSVRWRMAILGAGLGMAMPTLTLALQNAVQQSDIGVATAGRQFFQQLGQVIGSAVFGVILTATLTTALTNNLQPVLEKLPPETAAQFDVSKLRNGSGGSESATGETPNIGASVEAKVAENLSATEQLMAAASTGDAQAKAQLLTSPMLPPTLRSVLESDAAATPEQQARIDAEWAEVKKQAVAQGQEMGASITQAVKNAFTDSITQIYRYALPMVILGLLLALFIPELPLRRTNAMPVHIE